MSKNKKNEAPKQEPKKEQKAPKTPGKAPKAPEVKNPKTEEQVEEPEVITIPKASNPKNLTSRKYSGLSMDGQVKLLDLARRTFVEETDPDLQFPQTVRKSVNMLVSTGIICTFADHAASGDNTFALVLQSQAYPALVAAAKELNIELPDIKALPSGKEEGTVILPSNSVKISKETKEKLKKEKEIRESEKPELDPEKITAEEDVKKALEYMFVKSNGKRLPELITSSIDFMKKFREHQAELAENTEEAKARLANYNSGDWLDDVFSHFTPPIFFEGIGRGMATVTENEKSPIHAFTILREAIKDKETGQPVLSDQEIAYCVKSVVRWICNTKIASNKKAIENLDAEKNAEEIKKCQSAIERHENVLSYITNPSSDEVDTLLENVGSYFDESGSQLTPECSKANATFNRVCQTYYGKQMSGADYKNLANNVQQYAGCILNLFRDSGSQLVNYKLSNITELEKRSEEEREELLKKAKKDFMERKSKEKKTDEKNA